MLFAYGSVPAQAAVPGPRAKAMPVLITQNGKTVGQMKFDLVYSDGVARGTARASQLKLTNGRKYLLRTCVWAKAPGVRPESHCQSKTVTIDLLTEDLAS